jgi:hypothetical protein
MTHTLNCKNKDQNANSKNRQHVFMFHHNSKEQIHKNSTRSFQSQKGSECLTENPSTSSTLQLVCKDSVLFVGFWNIDCGLNKFVISAF